MNSDSDELPDHPDASQGTSGVRTLSDAKTWLAKMAEDGAAQVQIKEPCCVLGGGWLIVTASLVREDGARVNIEVYCYDDRGPASIKRDLFPFPTAAALPGTN